jgi:uncharacterized protein (TIGR02588 family)
MRRNALEWFVLVVGVLVVVGLVGTLAWQSIGYSDHPPVIAVRALPHRAEGSPIGWQIPIEIRNEGDQTAAQISIEAIATVDGTDEVAPLDIDLLAGGGSLVRVIAFSGEPEGDVRFRLVGFTVP